MQAASPRRRVASCRPAAAALRWVGWPRILFSREARPRTRCALARLEVELTRGLRCERNRMTARRYVEQTLILRAMRMPGARLAHRHAARRACSASAASWRWSMSPISSMRLQQGSAPASPGSRGLSGPAPARAFASAAVRVRRCDGYCTQYRLLQKTNCEKTLNIDAAQASL